MPPLTESSRRARIRAGLSALLLLAIVPAVLQAQISPGPLSRAHSSLSGSSNCTSCHKLGLAEPVFKCLDCHKEIASRLSAGRGFHAAVVKRGSDSQECRTCHSEHNGENFRLVRWQPSLEQFDHSRTGWALEGKHTGLTCAQCHTPMRMQVADKLAIRIKDLTHSYLGLPRECAACHSDQHQGRLGRECQQCHSTADWKAVSHFDHSKTKYQLTGLHLKVECARCHLPGPDQKPQWTGLAFESCTSCHRDPHRGSFQNSCQTCHTTNGWKSVSMATLESKFDHSSTKFPLLGKHTGLECAKCHANGNFKQPIAFQRCSDCHRDAHNGQFAQRPDKGECSSCHTVEGFKPALFDIVSHSKTAYPLEGKHEWVECAKCHAPAGKATLFKIKFAMCTDCHRDAHAGQFQSAPNLGRCENCHTVKGFRPSTFTLARHSTARYQLAGAHVAVPCGDCHKEGLMPKYPKVAAYRFGSFDCTTCHQDPHKSQFKDRMTKTGKDGKALGCLACHTIETWKDLNKFDHSTTRFQLVGAHRAVACADCHKPPNLELTMMNVDFKSTPTKCEDCHSDIHGGQFAYPATITLCDGCHTSNKWKPSTFDHNTRTTFKLEGVHANVRCARCHTLIKSVDGKDVLFYKPTPTECAACHGPNVKGF